ncbi:MAG: DsrE family protein [Pseudomonadota bacterium]
MSHVSYAHAPLPRQARGGWLLVLCSVLLLALAVPQARAEGMAKVVYHADFADPRRFSAMLTSINNMVNHYANEFIEYDVRIVFVAHGVRFVTDDKLAGTPFAEDKQLAGQRENLRGRLLTLAELHNVKLELCNITRSQIGLAEDRLYSAVELIPSGVVRLAQLQQEEGFAYIKIE